MLKSQLCKEADFTTPWFRKARVKLKQDFKYHRKIWEWCFIYEALRERNVLGIGKSGLGFGVGKEPLSALFASLGTIITATDLSFEQAKEGGWVKMNQHANDLHALNESRICEVQQLEKFVTYESVDMNHIPSRYNGQFDFTWSACSLEHLGSIANGLSFIKEQMKCLRPGGVAVHTSEFNLSSNKDTIENHDLVIFRRRDFEHLVSELEQQGNHISIDYTAGFGPHESYIDLPPYKSPVHLRLKILQYQCTSIGLIIEKSCQ